MVLEKGFYDPIKDTLLTLLTVEKRQTIFYIVIAYMAAYVIYNDKAVQKDPSTKKGFLNFIGGKKVFLHPSAIMDYKYFFLQPILKIWIVAPLLGLLFFPDFLSGKALSDILSTLLGPAEKILELNDVMIFVYGVMTFLIYDFSHYWTHRLFHANKWLWEFHKVHHAAEVLVPPTANRIHFVETIIEGVIGFTLVSHLAGIFYYFSGDEVAVLKVMGVGYLSFIFNCLASNLRHTHIWLSFGPKVERFINSPAQHQIHHSTLQHHYNKNFGTNLSIWDWMFGTLYVTTSKQEEIKFGLGSVESRRFSTVPSLIFAPFTVCFKRALRRIKKLKGKSV